MFKKVSLLFPLLCSALIASTSATPTTKALKAKTNVNVDCGFVQTNYNIQLTYGIGSFTTNYVNFAARYITNPYTQSQWEQGIVIGHLDGCSVDPYAYGRRTQYDGRVMEAGVTPTGNVVIKWISGPVMPTSADPQYYFMQMSHVTLSSTGS